VNCRKLSLFGNNFSPQALTPRAMLEALLTRKVYEADSLAFPRCRS
jgi:hypothetical protein